MDDQARYERAKKQVEEIKGFYSHFFVYVLVNIALFLLNVLTSPHHFWFYWPLIFWGIGLAVHAVRVFGGGRFWGQEWEERKIKEIMERDRGERGD
ncbi:MAG: histidine kinase [Latescibacteria bacterium DG_63]|nr:MAG: histidine kinase [Latescibacteria bacterium DG_63]